MTEVIGDLCQSSFSGGGEDEVLRKVVTSRWKERERQALVRGCGVREGATQWFCLCLNMGAGLNIGWTQQKEGEVEVPEKKQEENVGGTGMQNTGKQLS